MVLHVSSRNILVANSILVLAITPRCTRAQREVSAKDNAETKVLKISAIDALAKAAVQLLIHALSGIVLVVESD